MSVLDLASRLSKEVAAGGTLDWVRMRNEISEEHERAATAEERVICLQLHKAVMDAVERQAPPEILANFKKTRLEDYNRLLVSEALIGCTDGNVDPTKLLEITRREIAAGRMSPDAKVHELAVIGARFIGPPAKQKESFLRRLFSKRPPY
jgi:hypothetical protein